MAEYSIIIVVPCFNEEKRMELEFFSRFLKANPDYFLLFVNDGSNDNTLHAVESLQSSSPNTAVLSLPGNVGKGEAVRQGILHSLDRFQFDLIGYADADLSTPLEEFHRFRKIIKDDEDIRIVLGSRVQMLGKNIRRSLWRHWFGRIIATAIGKVINEPVYDSQCGAKLFSKATAADLFPEKFISKWLFDIELLARYKHKYGSEVFRKTIIEIPVNNWTEKEDSKLRYHYFFRMIYDLVKIRNRYFRKK